MHPDHTHPPLRRLRRVAPLLALLLGAGLGAWALGDSLSFEALRDNRETLLALRDSHYEATVAGFVALYVLIVAFSLPGATIATLTGGFLFGTWVGTVVNVSAATLGAVVIFSAVRLGFGTGLAARMENSPGLVGRIKHGIDTNQWSMLFLIRLVPAVPFFVANIVPALVGVPLVRFAISTFFGIIPAGLVYTSVGAGLGDVFAAGARPDLGVIFQPHILGPLLGLSALALLPVLLGVWRGRKGL
ncbi:MAG: TVP38/TMEM64 family protein [Rhodobacteraceae bacterium]|nr:TVP38/TMEM64 family protein [Paracoccaceae bacterium]